MVEQQTLIWHCPAGDQFRWDHWDEESLLFDCRSGQTHSLTPLAVEVILLLKKKSLSVNDIANQLNDMFADISNHVSLKQVTELLEHCDALGLIEECHPQK